MASVRETNNLIMKRLDCLEKATSEIRTFVKGNREVLDLIRPQSYLPAIPRPKQGVGISRTSSIATYLRNEISILNSTKKDGEPRYLEFPVETSDKQVNTDALNCLEIILMFHLDFHYGRMSWEKVTKKMPRVAATIYREARTTPELAVFAQTAALWAIDLLLTAKMKSRMRSNHDETNEQTRVETIPDVRISDDQAVSVVPEIVPNPLNHVPVSTVHSVHDVEVNGVQTNSVEPAEKHNQDMEYSSQIVNQGALTGDRQSSEGRAGGEKGEIEKVNDVEEQQRCENGRQGKTGARARRGRRGGRGGRGLKKTRRGGVERRGRASN